MFSTPLLKSLKVATGVTAFQFELLIDTVIVDMLATDCLFAGSFCLSLFITLCLFNRCLPGNFLVRDKKFFSRHLDYSGD